MFTLLKIVILGIIQGAAELLPVSSTAHVIVAEKLMRIDPTGPQAMFVLAMLHTGTMFAVLVYFWRAWRISYFSSRAQFVSVAAKGIGATVVSGLLGLALIKVIEKFFLAHTGTGDIEELSGNLFLVAGALAVAGVLILISGMQRGQPSASHETGPRYGGGDVAWSVAWAMGIAQGLCLPFRGLSRSGTTISVGLLAGARRRRTEEFSFALAILITPAVIYREFHRLLKSFPGALHDGTLGHLMAPGLIGLIASFLAGLAALRLLSHWLERGRWSYFGYYCLVAAVTVLALGIAGF